MMSLHPKMNSNNKLLMEGGMWWIYVASLSTHVTKSVVVGVRKTTRKSQFLPSAPDYHISGYRCMIRGEIHLKLNIRNE